MKTGQFADIKQEHQVPAGWREATLGEVCDIKSGKSNSEDSSESGKYPLFDRSRTVKRSHQYLFDTTAIIVAGEGKEFIPKYYSGKFDLHQRAYAIYNFDKSVDSRYIYYYLMGKRKYFASVAVGSTVLSLRQNHFENFPVSLPPLPEQKAIAEVLGSLDDKIDLLQRQNQTLENLAQTLFRQWFIEEADPSWEEKPLDEIADYLNGLASQKYPPENDIDKLPVLKIRELRNGFAGDPDWATSKVDSKYIVGLGDIIFSWSGSLLLKIWDGERCILNQHLFKVTSKKYPKWFYYFWTKYYLNKFISIADSKATTMGHIKRTDLSNSLVLLPKYTTLLKMNKEISPLFEKLILNYRKLATLRSLHNDLLPMLLAENILV